IQVLDADDVQRGACAVDVLVQEFLQWPGRAVLIGNGVFHHQIVDRHGERMSFLRSASHLAPPLQLIGVRAPDPLSCQSRFRLKRGFLVETSVSVKKMTYSQFEAKTPFKASTPK